MGGRFDLFFRGSGATVCAVKKLSKAILLALGAVLVLVGFGLFCVNLYIQSPRVQEQLQEQLGQALRMPLKITNTSLSPWSGLRVTGISIPNGHTTFLEAGSFSADYRLLPLLTGTLSISEMSVDRPKIVWRQDAEGKWKLPALEKKIAAAAENNAPQPDKAERKSEGGFKVVIGRFLVKGGAVDLVDKDGRHTATFTDVNMTYTSLSEENVEGTAVIGRAVWADTVALENVRTPFKYAAGELILPEVTATLAGGSVRGSYRAQPDAPKSPFETAFTFEQVNLDRLATQAGWKPGQAGGLASGKLALHGDMRRAERAEGGGEFQLRDGQFRQLEFLQTIGQALNIRELSDLRLKDGRGEFRVGGEKVTFDRLTLTAANLQLSAKKGTVRFDQKVDIDAQLAVEEGILKQLPDLVRASFATADNGQRTIDFNIGGSTEKLRTNLLDKLIGQKIGQQFDDLLTGIFGGGSKEDEKRKKEEEERKKEERRAEKKVELKRKKEQEKPNAAKTPSAKGAPTTAITPVKP